MDPSHGRCIEIGWSIYFRSFAEANEVWVDSQIIAGLIDDREKVTDNVTSPADK